MWTVLQFATTVCTKSFLFFPDIEKVIIGARMSDLIFLCNYLHVEVISPTKNNLNTANSYATQLLFKYQDGFCLPLKNIVIKLFLIPFNRFSQLKDSIFLYTIISPF